MKIKDFDNVWLQFYLERVLLFILLNWLINSRYFFSIEKVVLYVVVLGEFFYDFCICDRGVLSYLLEGLFGLRFFQLCRVNMFLICLCCRCLKMGWRIVVIFCSMGIYFMFNILFFLFSVWSGFCVVRFSMQREFSVDQMKRVLLFFLLMLEQVFLKFFRFVLWCWIVCMMCCLCLILDR